LDREHVDKKKRVEVMMKRTPSELWDALDEATVDAELEAILNMTPEERRRELVEAGYDLDQVHADADACFASLPAATSAQAAAPAPRPRRMRPAVVAPIALLIAVGVALMNEVASAPATVGTGRPDDAPLGPCGCTREARDACESRSWKTCLDKFDQARALDPSDNEIPEAQSLRHAAVDGVGHP
jgi:hypothetical protein